MVAFGRDGVMSDTLRVAACRFMLVDCIEQKAERPHAVIKKRKGYDRAGPVSVSTALRLPEWEQRIDSDPGFMQRLATQLEDLRSPQSAASTLNLDCHPSLVGF
eukprot:14210804-Alexandrium_andersonii.AAC.1